MGDVFHPGRVFVFGDFRFRADELLLERSGDVVSLTPKTLKILLVLVENAGHVVAKERLFALVWPGTFVVESSLTRNVSALRRALEEDGGLAGAIETVPKRGYRFRAPVQLDTGVEPPTATSITRRRTIAAAIVLLSGAAAWTLRSSSYRVEREASPARRLRLIGDHHLDKRNPADVRRALELFDQSLALDPDLADAHAGRAEAWVLLAELAGESPKRSFGEAMKSAQRAMTLNPTLARAHFSLAWAQLKGDWDWRAAEATLRRGLELQPDSATGHERLACLLSVLGRKEEAAAATRRALDLDPASPRTGAMAASVWYRLRRYEDAAREARAVLDREPGYSMAWHTLALASAQLGRYDEAVEQLQRVRTSNVVRNNDIGWIQAQAGHPEIARAMLADIETEIRSGRLTDDSHLLLDVALGRHDSAIRTLERWAEKKNPTVLGVIPDPRFDVLRGDPGFQAVVEQFRKSEVLTARDLGHAVN